MEESARESINLAEPHRPKITEKLFFLFSGGIMSTPFLAMANFLISAFLLINLDYYTALTISVVAIAPFLEEFAKAYPLFYRHGETERSLVTLGFLTGIGFGIAEFFLYIFFYQSPVFIRLPLVFFHAATTTIVAYGISKNKSFIFYLIAVALHSIVNIFALMGGGWEYGLLIVVVLAYILAYQLYKKTAEVIIDFWICKTR